MRNPFPSLIVLTVAAFLWLTTGCATVKPTVFSAVPSKPVAQEIKITVQSDDKVSVSDANRVIRTMEVPNDEPAWPTNVMQVGDTVHYTLWAGIDTMDPLNFWKTVLVAKYKGLCKIHVYINSGGGSAFAGLGFADNILAAIADGFTVTTEANGIVASAAVPIFAVGQYRTSTRGTMFMIHEGKMFKMFAEESRNDLQSQKKMMDMIEDRYNLLLKDHSKLSLDQIAQMCAATTWFTAEEAQKFGLVDEVK
jgi:ATP-dependent protease ClpP protease subunit